MPDKIYKLTAHEISSLIRARKISAVEIAESFISRISEIDQQVKSYLLTTPEVALRQAEAVDDAIERGEELSPLAGIPWAAKDNISTRGIATTCASKMLENYKPVFDATVVEKLNADGTILLGKSNLDEFAMGSSTENSAFFTTRNPWNLDVIPGGSSGGSAAAVSADECAFSLGSDTGGSIRQPASCCGVVGLKPTYGRVSRYGILAFASSLDQVGPITKDVEDCALVLNSICGRDNRDAASLDVAVPDFTKALINDIKGLRIGVPKEFFVNGTDSAVEKAVMEALAKLKELGAEWQEISLPIIDHSFSAFYVIAPSECSSNMARYDGVRYGMRSKLSKDTDSLFIQTRTEGFGSELKQRIILGTYFLSAGNYETYYVKAQQARTLLRLELEKTFEKFDVIVSPTSPYLPFGIGEKADDPIAINRADTCTILANLVGIPAISIPCGFGSGLPIGLQIMGKCMDEESVLRVAYTFEQNTDFHKHRPAL